MTDDPDGYLDGAARADRAARALGLPLPALLGVRLLDDGDPAAGVWFTVGDGPSDNGAGGLHAGALAAVLEGAAYLALLGHLRRSEHAVTHAVATQLFGAAPLGDRVEVRGSVDARTGRLGFVTVVAATPAGPIARSQVTKSVVRHTG